MLLLNKVCRYFGLFWVIMYLYRHKNVTKNMATVRLVPDTRVKKDGSQMVLLVVRMGKTRFVFSTGISTPSSEEFNEVSLLGKSVSQYKVKNVRLASLRNMAEKLMIDEENKLTSLPSAKAKCIISEVVFGETINKKTKCFIDYLDEFISLKSNSGTKLVYNTTRVKLQEYDPECTFDTMDRKWLASFENWMSGSGMKVNAYAIHLRNIRAVFNYAIDEEITTLYPFRKYKIKKEETRKRSLTIEQIRILKDYPCEEFEERYRDLFMLSFYLIGINIGDMLLLKGENIVNGRIEYHRQKTGKLYSVKIEPEAQAIIDRYKGREYLLNVLDEYSNYKDFISRINKALKNIGPFERKGLGGKKVRQPLFPDLSTYWARHTWATIAHKADVPKDTISLALGHSFGCDVTDIYIDFDRDKIDEANRMVLDYIK